MPVVMTGCGFGSVLGMAVPSVHNKQSPRGDSPSNGSSSVNYWDPPCNSADDLVIVSIPPQD
ncbi:uncharacterized protein N7469_002079 [Penicillium citrinum]|uniref:Uncharacterized protein n=1 Tax=Penicillium citrinum TaxID=5077 RepID=A0A9W9TTU7_PENCI|nr:uncharacterized protein N7469_002079 [Penicillium citrinum]KAJ5240488.1 hypothetical protein N7469_002079 [Penicillium citrinum]